MIFFESRLSILVSQGDAHLMWTKGALSNVLDVCHRLKMGDGVVVEHCRRARQNPKHFEEFSGNGFRSWGRL